MRHDLSWSYAAAGAMNSANSAGYLIGALAAGPLAHRSGARRCYVVALALSIVALGLSAIPSEFVLLLLLRLLVGVSGAVIFIAGAALAAHVGGRGHGRLSAVVLGLYTAGAGAGIVLSAPIVQTVLHIGGWRWGWGALGGTALVLCPLAIWAATHLSMEPVEATATPSPIYAPLSLILLSYGIYGAGYIAYMTFIVAFLRNSGLSGGEITAFWSLLGVASVASAFAWGTLISRARGGQAVSVILAVVTVGAAVPLAVSAWAAALVSALLFGGGFLAVVAAVTALARRALPPAAWTAGIAALTICFALGQSIGPILTGVLSDRAGGIRDGLVLSVALLAVSALLPLFWREGRAAGQVPEEEPLKSPA
jgi:predicted MFS family arabinose efflux permease